MRFLVIYNLSSGPKDGAIFDYLRMLLDNGDEAVVRTTDGSTPVSSMMHDVKEFDAIVVAGGDGTVSSTAYHAAYTGIPILPFPAGTANLLANNLASPYEPHALAKMTHDMNTLDFDLGEIEIDGKRFGFGIMAGAGYDATIMKDAKPAKRILGDMAYFQAAFANPLPQKSRIRLTIDGKVVEREGLGVLIINFSKIQFDISLTHENEPRDGTFDVVILKAQNAFGLIPALIAGFLDRDGDFPSRTDSLEIFRGCDVYVEADPPMQIQYDGEVPGFSTPFYAHLLGGAARFIVSEEGYDLFSLN